MNSFLTIYEDLRGIINPGHRRGTVSVVRLCGDVHEPRIFSTWFPKVLAGIKRLPHTVEDRSIKINMRRKKTDEKTEQFRQEKEAPKLEDLRRKILRFANDIRERIVQADPEIPKELNDRQADCWRPLLAVADLLGGGWPKKARRQSAKKDIRWKCFKMPSIATMEAYARVNSEKAREEIEKFNAYLTSGLTQ